MSQTSVPEVKSCCSVSSDILCNINGFSGWLASLPLLNLKSINLDALLLERISKCAQKDPSEAHKVCFFLYPHGFRISLLFPPFVAHFSSTGPDYFEC